MELPIPASMLLDSFSSTELPLIIFKASSFFYLGITIVVACLGLSFRSARIKEIKLDVLEVEKLVVFTVLFWHDKTLDELVGVEIPV